MSKNLKGISGLDTGVRLFKWIMCCIFGFGSIGCDDVSKNWDTDDGILSATISGWTCVC